MDARVRHAANAGWLDLRPIDHPVQGHHRRAVAHPADHGNREQNASVWIDGTTASITGRRVDDNVVPSYAGVENSLNYTPYYTYGGSNSIDMLYGPSSMHGSIVNHLYADGSVQGLSDALAPTIYDALITRAGNELVNSNDVN